MGDASGPVNGDNNPNGQSANHIYEKYAQERDKRLRADGNRQYVTLRESSSASDTAKDLFRRFAADPWANELLEAQRAQKVRASLPDGSHTRILIVGAGNGGIFFAVKLLKAGFSLDDILIVDTAGGFGGTWYWNRYPGLMCDVESYIYLPMLEETGYMPRHKYSYGPEIRDYVNSLAEKWELHRAAMFKTRVTGLTWDEENASWTVGLEQEALNQLNGGAGDTKIPLTLHSDFVVLATGILNVPKMPSIPGIDQFKGHSFHTSRWDYDYTGGSPKDQQLTKLRDKKVAIIGTGATAVQAVPELAKWTKELTVFQRTPSAVDVRDNRETDADWWARTVTSRGKGWQRERMENYNDFIASFKNPPKTNLVDDAWTAIDSYCVLTGGPDNQDEGFVEQANAVDIARQERVRKRVEDIVRHKDTAQNLKAWYASYCKRPCFHDEYLHAFNEPHVRLVDTDGKGISRVTERGLVVAPCEAQGREKEEEYEADLIVFSTGFALTAIGSPASRGGFQIAGRNGADMDTTWNQKGVSTLHGVMSRGFPNLFFPGANQAGTGPNHSYTLDVLSTHITHIIAETAKKAGSAASGGMNPKRAKVTIEPSAQAEQAWGDDVARRAISLAGIANCTPSYQNNEGTRLGQDPPPEILRMVARMSTWGKGVNDFARVVGEWRAKGDMEGMEIVLKDGGDTRATSRAIRGSL